MSTPQPLVYVTDTQDGVDQSWITVVVTESARCAYVLDPFGYTVRRYKDSIVPVMMHGTEPLLGTVAIEAGRLVVTAC
jgi:hypothetical protein